MDTEPQIGFYQHPGNLEIDSCGVKAVAKFFVPGTCKTAGSKRAFVPKGWSRAVIVDTSGKAGKDWRGDIKRFAGDAYKGPLIECALTVEFTFQIARPQSHFGTGRNKHLVKDSAPKWPATRPDLLKYSRAAEDALTSVLWRDDSQIVSETLNKVYGVPGMWVTIREML